MTEIRLYNTRTRKKEAFAPIDPENVRMYVCGPTVYDRAHIGNARPVVVFDVLYRLLRHVYGPDHVTYVRNFTDVDDKIIDKAVATRREGETLEAATRRITDETIGWYHDDMDALGALRPDHEPRCTEMIPQMVAMIEALIAKGHAYAAEGHVLFAVESYSRYGALSGRSVDDMIAGSRVEVAPYKKNPMDFVLWKPSTPDQPGWESPWGRGRPGWHIECSAMAKDLLGEVFDIHAGGIDLQFPHHENELAQSCCVHDTDVMANWWMHNEMVRVEGEKMSKSLGNFFTPRSAYEAGTSWDAMRLVFLRTHYRQPLDWTSAKVQEAEIMLDRWQRLTTELTPSGSQVNEQVLSALSDDMNTSLAISAVHALQGDPAALLDSARFLGLLGDSSRADWRAQHSHEGYEISYRGVPSPADDELLLRFRERYFEQYRRAKESKDFSVVDSLRATANELGIVVQVSVNTVSLKVSRPFTVEERSALSSELEALQ